MYMNETLISRRAAAAVAVGVLCERDCAKCVNPLFQIHLQRWQRVENFNFAAHTHSQIYMSTERKRERCSSLKSDNVCKWHVKKYTWMQLFEAVTYESQFFFPFFFFPLLDVPSQNVCGKISHFHLQCPDIISVVQRRYPRVFMVIREASAPNEFEIFIS